jgi:hypothetical protein
MLKTGISENICSERTRQGKGEYRDYYSKYNRNVYAVLPSLCFVV